MQDNIKKLPTELTQKPRFILWRLGDIKPETGRPKKVPHNKAGYPCNPLDSKHWLSFNDAKKILSTGKFSGIGFVLNGDGLCCLDIDDASKVDKHSKQALKAFDNTWIEQSQSGDGYHIFFTDNPSKQPQNHAHFQLYTDKQYIALTGNTINANNQIKAIDFDRVYPLNFKLSKPVNKPTQTPQKPPISTAINQDMLSNSKVLEIAFKAKNGAKIKGLYESSPNSEGDLSLASMLAFYTNSSVGGGDAQLLQIMQSAPFIESRKKSHKWADYLPRTIAKATNNLSNTFAPRPKKAKTPDNIQQGFNGELGYQMLSDGLHLFYEKNNKTVDEQITYSPFEIVANTCNEDNEEWGKLLHWHDLKGKEQEFLIPNESLAGDGREYREVLLSLGLMIKPRNKTLMTEYLATHNPQKFLLSANKTGWNAGAFVFPDGTIGGADVIMQSQKTLKKEFAQLGTIQDWQQHVASKCENNSRLIFSVSLAFATMLLPFTNEESGGVQLTGSSSGGKTTAGWLASSVFGDPRSFVKQWRNTSNALEAVAMARNDSLLILDELSQVEPRDAGETIYMLANGSGKGRMTRNAQLREPKTWRLLFLSTGEISLAEHMKTAGKKTRAGQETRIIDIPADTGIYGVFEELHGIDSGAVFSETLKRDCLKYHGVPARLFAKTVADKDPAQLAIDIDNTVAPIIKFLLPDGKVDGQVSRVARRFAMIAVGGIIATSAGITGWKDDSVTIAVKKCFQAWLDQRGGTGSIEEREILKQVHYFFEQYGNSRFMDVGKDAPTFPESINNMAGVHNEENYYVLPNVFNNQLCEGYKPSIVKDICIKHGLLIRGNDQIQVRKSIPNMGQQRVFHMNISE